MATELVLLGTAGGPMPVAGRDRPAVCRAEMTTPKPPLEDMEDLDPGLARGRTALAWIRMAIWFAALGGAILKMAPLAGVPVLAASALIWGIGRLPRRYEGRDSPTAVTRSC
jgi:Domain of unknown function (DUF202)